MAQRIMQAVPKQTETEATAPNVEHTLAELKLRLAKQADTTPKATFKAPPIKVLLDGIGEFSAESRVFDEGRGNCGWFVKVEGSLDGVPVAGQIMLYIPGTKAPKADK